MKKPKITLKETLSVWKDTFTKWQYILIAITTAILFYSFNVIIKNFSTLTSHSSQGIIQTLTLFILLFIGFKETLFLTSFISTILISILFGILLVFIIHKTKILKSISDKGGILTTLGISLGVFAPGCAACGIGFLSVFGITAATISFLPFNGMELSILAIIILTLTIITLTKSIKRGIVCDVKI